MFARALIAFLVLPGVVSFGVPLTWLWATGHWHVEQPSGLALVVAGLVGLLWCVRDFYVAGRGTLAPWAPPKHLVAVGLYRYSRNPMYLAVVTILLGWCASFGSAALLVYVAVVAIAFHMRVVFVEEPVLRRTFGSDWMRYSQNVPRWLWPIAARH